MSAAIVGTGALSSWLELQAFNYSFWSYFKFDASAQSLYYKRNVTLHSERRTGPHLVVESGAIQEGAAGYSRHVCPPPGDGSREERHAGEHHDERESHTHPPGLGVG